MFLRTLASVFTGFHPDETRFLGYAILDLRTQCGRDGAPQRKARAQWRTSRLDHEWELIKAAQMILERGETKVLILLHTMGSHVVYSSRYTPEFNRFPSDPATCTKARMWKRRFQRTPRSTRSLILPGFHATFSSQITVWQAKTSSQECAW